MSLLTVYSYGEVNTPDLSASNPEQATDSKDRYNDLDQLVTQLADRVKELKSDSKEFSDDHVWLDDRVRELKSGIKDFRSTQVFSGIDTGNNTTTQRTYYLSGALHMEIEMKNGIPDGVTKTYSEGGVVIGEMNYKKGKLYGPSHMYGADGRLVADVSYDNDIRHGISRIYYENGALLLEQEFDLGRLVSATQYDIDGNPLPDDLQDATLGVKEQNDR